MIQVVELGGFASARTLHHTAEQDPALVYFRTLADRREFDGLKAFCAERLLFARGPVEDLRWRKDSAIAYALQGEYLQAAEILRGSEWLADGLTGGIVGRYQNEFGIVLARLGRSSLALDRFSLAYQAHRRDGNPTACAQVNHNRARALMTRGETQKAMRYIRRALDYARANNDDRLEIEVLESIVEFGGA